MEREEDGAAGPDKRRCSNWAGQIGAFWFPSAPHGAESGGARGLPSQRTAARLWLPTGRLGESGEIGESGAIGASGENCGNGQNGG